jgi:hypothetical protein
MRIERRIQFGAGLALGTALWMILPDWRSHLVFLGGFHDYVKVAGITVGLSIALFESILLVHLISAIGLFRGYRWAWFCVVVVLSVQILLTFIGAIRLALTPPASVLPIDPSATIETISLWPAYFKAMLNAVSVLFLLSPSVRSRFLQQRKKPCGHCDVV